MTRSTMWMMVVAMVGLTGPAQAATWDKDMTVWGRVDRPQGDFVGGEVGLDRVRAYYCAGGGAYEDFVVNATVDPVAGFSATVTVTGDYCSITWMFSSDFEIDGDGTMGSFTVESSDAEVDVTVSGSMGWVALNPWLVSAGTMPGSAGPHLTTWVE